MWFALLAVSVACCVADMGQYEFWLLLEWAVTIARASLGSAGMVAGYVRWWRWLCGQGWPRDTSSLVKLVSVELWCVCVVVVGKWWPENVGEEIVREARRRQV